MQVIRQGQTEARGCLLSKRPLRVIHRPERLLPILPALKVQPEWRKFQHWTVLRWSAGIYNEVLGPCYPLQQHSLRFGALYAVICISLTPVNSGTWFGIRDLGLLPASKDLRINGRQLDS